LKETIWLLVRVPALSVHASRRSSANYKRDAGATEAILMGFERTIRQSEI
jgi:hypothetical protein